MSNNPELGGSQPNNSQAKQWEDKLPQDNFYQFRQNSQEIPREATPESPQSALSDEEIRQILIAEKRNEQLKNNSEALEKVKNVAKKLAATAAIAILLFGGSVATTSHKDFLESDQAKQKVVVVENVTEVVFHGNIRSNPEIPNSEDPSNIYSNIENEVRIEVPKGTKILYLRDDNDPNGGGWIAIPVKLLEDEAFISKSEAEEIRNYEEESKKGDGYVWLNTGNATANTG